MNAANELLMSLVCGSRVSNGIDTIYLTEDQEYMVIEPIGDNPSINKPFDFDYLFKLLSEDTWWNI